VLEQQANAFARWFEWMSIVSLSLQLLTDTREAPLQATAGMDEYATRNLWVYTLFSEANRACLFSLTADSAGHYVFTSSLPTRQPKIRL